MMQNRIQSALQLLPVLVLGLLLCSSITSTSASAVVAANWSAGRIIDDALFYDNNSMSAADIQNFLNSQVPTCDTNGTRPNIYNPSITNAQYAAQRGWPGPPYVCLRNYYQVPRNDQNINNLEGRSIPAGALSAAQIIKTAADTYGVSPKSLLSTLQKESPGPLITDDWPLASQYRNAMGYACPDTAPCNPVYEGFYNQMMNAARQFQLYKNNPNSYRYKPFQSNSIQFNPVASCGASNVYIENYATAGLYNYTPYQPNTAALNNLYGSGDGCSAYGNRNFWRIYNDWFDPIRSLGSGLTMNIVSQPDTTPARGQDVTYTVSFTNNLSYAVTLDAIGIVGRQGSVNGANRDFNWQGPVTLNPGVPQQFTFTTTIRDTGMIYAWPAVSYRGGYLHYNNWGVAMNSHLANISLTSPLSISSQNPVAGETVTYTASIRNNEDGPIRMDSVGIPIRYHGSYNYDTAWTNTSGSIAAGATVNLSGNIVLDKPGPYSAWVSSGYGGTYTTLSPTLSKNVTAPQPNFAMTYIETPNPTPAVGEDITVKFKLKNNLNVPMTLSAVGVVGRINNAYSGPNRDMGWVGPVSFAAGEEKSFTSFVSPVMGLERIYTWVAINYNGAYTHYNNWGFMLTPHLPNLTLSAPLTINSGNPITIGQTVPVTATVKNNENKPIKYSALGLPVRFYGVYNYDATWVPAGTLSPSGEVGDTVALSGNVRFDKPGPYTIWSSINLNGYYLTLGNQRQINL